MEHDNSKCEDEKDEKNITSLPTSKETINSDDVTNVKNVNEEKNMPSPKNGDDDIKHSNEDETDANAQHFDNSNDGNEPKLATSEHPNNDNHDIENERDDFEKDHDDFENDHDDFENGHDDYDDLEEEEEDLHAGENFWCSLCDDGGNLLFCDGPCLRTFHACISDREDHDCKTLGFTKEQYQIIVNAQTWICPNCETNQQICFLCHQLGKSTGPDQEVFNCHSAHCGHFYHPMCIAKWITRDEEKQKDYADLVEQNVETFLCPLHTCKSCKKLEDASNTEKKFAKCRRCPIGWHVDCLPKDVPFEKEAAARGIPQRAWKVELGDEKHHYHVGIYCPKHELPVHPYDMVKFPYRPTSRYKNVEGTNEFSESNIKESVQSKSLNLYLKTNDDKEKHHVPRISKIKLPTLEQKRNLIDDVKVEKLFDEHKSFDNKQSLKSKQSSTKKKTTFKEKINDLIESPLISLNDIKKSVDSIISKSRDYKTIEEVKRNLCTPSFYNDKNGEKEGKFIHEGELTSILTSIPKALNWIKSGKRIDEAKALCPVRSIIQLERVEKALEAFLNPCLYGQRYTSFGRHFTKREILIEIVDRLQWYINDKDTVVDFCCGANEFSIEVYRKLHEVGKKNCVYKNFDILAPKNEFNFEQRDWFTIKHHELPCGDKLIMGLNPPFGKRSALANAFINHAVTFRPKIIILIVPPCTKSLQEHGYELVWQDPRLLGGQAFYLPGSISKDIVNANGTTRFTVGEDWNKNTPPLYLWSRTDWIVDHQQIALKHGHLSALSSNRDQPPFNISYQSKVNKNKISTLEIPQQVPSIEKSSKTIFENNVNGIKNNVANTKVPCAIDSRLQVSKGSKIPIEEPLKKSTEAPETSIDNGPTSLSESRRRKLVKKLNPRMNTKEDAKEVEKVNKVERRSTRNKNPAGSTNKVDANEHLEKPLKIEILEEENLPRSPGDVKTIHESKKNQLENFKEKKNCSLNVSDNDKAIDEEIKHDIGIKSEDNVDKQHAIARLKRARSPDMMLDHKDVLDSRAKRFHVEKCGDIREPKRPSSKDEDLPRSNVHTSSEDINHRQRIKKRDAENPHCNKSNTIQENVEQERMNRNYNTKPHPELERKNRTHYGRHDGEQEWGDRINHGRQDLEQERANRIHHRRHDVDKRDRFKKDEFEMNREPNARSNLRYEESRRNYNCRDVSPKSRRLMNLRDSSPRPRRSSGSRDLESESRRLSNSRDLELEPRRLGGPRDIDHEPRRSNDLRDMELELRQMGGLRDSESGLRRFRSPRDLSPKSRRLTSSRDVIDQQRLEPYDQFNMRKYDDDDVRRSPEKSRGVGITKAQCTEDEQKGITYPKWYTAQNNTYNIGRPEGNRSSNLSIDLEGESFGREPLKFPSLHGNYGLPEFSTHSQTYGTNYSDLTKDNYLDNHSSNLKNQIDYLNPEETTYMQKNKYETHGFHSSSNDFNCFDTKPKNYANQTFGMNNLHSLNQLDGGIGRDYGINDFPRSSLVGSTMPNLSKPIGEDSWNYIPSNIGTNDILTSYRNDIPHTSLTKPHDYIPSWNNIPPSSPSSTYIRHSTFENPHISSLGSSWNQPNLYPLPSTNLMPFSQREPWS